jgi:hypothetical protein
MKGVKLGDGMYYIQSRVEKFFATYRHSDKRRKIGKIFGSAAEAEMWLKQMTDATFEEIYKNRVLFKTEEKNLT